MFRSEICEGSGNTTLRPPLALQRRFSQARTLFGGPKAIGGIGFCSDCCHRLEVQLQPPSKRAAGRFLYSNKCRPRPPAPKLTAIQGGPTSSNKKRTIAPLIWLFRIRQRR